MGFLDFRLLPKFSEPFFSSSFFSDLKLWSVSSLDLLFCLEFCLVLGRGALAELPPLLEEENFRSRTIGIRSGGVNICLISILPSSKNSGFISASNFLTPFAAISINVVEL